MSWPYTTDSVGLKPNGIHIFGQNQYWNCMSMIVILPIVSMFPFHNFIVSTKIQLGFEQVKKPAEFVYAHTNTH